LVEEEINVLDGSFFLSIEGWLSKTSKLKSSYKLLRYLLNEGLITKRKVSDKAGNEIQETNDERAKEDPISIHELVTLPITSILSVTFSLDIGDSELFEVYELYSENKK
jgi:hypothetical protein